jgi:hypothetical protein
MPNNPRGNRHLCERRAERTALPPRGLTPRAPLLGKAVTRRGLAAMGRQVGFPLGEAHFQGRHAAVAHLTQVEEQLRDCLRSSGVDRADVVTSKHALQLPD